MKATFISASIHPIKYNKNMTNWPTEDGWSAEVVIVNEDQDKYGGRTHIDKTIHFSHYTFTSVWEAIGKIKLECDDSQK